MHPPGVGYFEMFAPVAWKESINVALALAADKDLVIEHVDVDTAFLFGEVKEEIFMDQPEGIKNRRQLEEEQSRRGENGNTD